jgi:hypothetical protein
VRANREIALLGNLIALAIERGEATANPCRGGQVPRNKERPRTSAPERDEIEALAKFAEVKGGHWVVVTLPAEFAALAGSRQAELLPLHWPQGPDRAPARSACLPDDDREGVRALGRVAPECAVAAAISHRGKFRALWLGATRR